MKNNKLVLTLWLICGGIAPMIVESAPEKSEASRLAEQFVARHEKEIAPMERKLNVAWWDANTSGKDADFAAKEKLQNQVDKLVADPERFKQLKAARDGLGKDAPALLKRQLDVLHLQYLEKQLDAKLLKEIVAKANAVEKAFNVFRAKVDGKEILDSALRQTLKSSKDSKERKAVWEASKEVGKAVEKDLKDLVALRNEAARKLGYKNFHAMQLNLAEQDQGEVMTLFDELDELTRKPFLAMKAEIDAKLSANYGLKPEELRPWHYHDPFFQEAPAVFATSLDATYARVDIMKINREFYAGIGLPIDDVLKRSDLYEKKGKSPHAFCTDIDRKGDVRVLANVVPTEYWMSTMLHELGHSVYSSKFIPASLPYVLRTESHILTTEGVAMLFQKFSKSADFLGRMGVKVEDPKAFNETGAKLRKNELLIFSRWCQVMLRFEKSLYEDPSQDLNKLWWDLVEKYQGLKRPEGRSAPDYASKIHVVSAPAYYHNYMMGELFASQVHHTIARDVLGGVEPAKADYVGKKEVGEYFKKKVFGPGRSLTWNELTKFATGETLSAKAFAADFGGK